MNPTADDDIVDLLAHRLDEYCRRHESGILPPQSSADPLGSDDDLSAELQERLHRAQTVAAWLAELSQRETLPAGEGIPRIGRRLGRFEIRSIQGMGGFGVVYRAFDPSVEREVALKVPRMEALLGRESRERFLQEARAAARLDHPNIAAVMESCEIDGLPIIVSAYCPGETFSEWIKAHPQGVDPLVAVEIIQQLADAVEHAHGRGVLHRDIKPANVLLVPASTSAESRLPFVPKLTDFGLAKLTESSGEHTRTGMLLGTVRYMAPEQAAGRVREIGAASDIYSLGMVFYELLTGSTAFQAETDVATLAMIQGSDVVPPRRLRPTIAKDIDAVCMKCLENSPSARYRSAGDLADDLCRAQRGDPTIARPLTRRERLLRWGKKRPALAALALVSLLSVFTILIGGTWYSYRLASSVAVTKASLERAIASETRSADLLYAAEMKLAGEAFARGGTLQVRQLLDRQVPRAGQADHRTFLWHLLNRGIHDTPVLEIENLGELYCQAVSADGAWMAVGGRDSKLHTIDTSSFQVQSSVDTGQQEINGVAISNDGSLIATAGKDSTAKLWRPGADQPLLTIAACPLGEAYTACFANGSDRLITTGNRDTAIRFWSTADGSRKNKYRVQQSSWIESFDISPARQRAVVIGEEGTIYLIDCLNYQIVLQEYVKRLGHATVAKFSPDGSRIAIGSKEAGILILEKDGSRRSYVEVSEHSKDALAWSSDGSRLFVGDRAGAIHVIEVQSSPEAAEERDPGEQPQESRDARLKVVKSWQAHQGKIWSLNCVPGCGSLISTGDDGRLKRWDTNDAADWRTLPVSESRGGVQAICFVPGRSALVSSYDALTRLDPVSFETQQIEPVIEDRNSKLAVSADGAIAARISWSWSSSSLTDSTVSFHSTQDLRQIGRGTIESHNRSASICFSADGRFLAVALSHVSNQVRLYEVPTFRPVATAQFKSVVMHVDRSIMVNGRECFLVCDENHLVALRHPDLAEIRRTVAHRYGIRGAVLSPDGRTAFSFGGDGLVKAWDLHSLECTQVFAGEHAQGQYLALSPDGSVLVSTEYESPRRRFWDVRTAQQVMAVSLPGDFGGAVLFSPNAKGSFITISPGQYIRVLDIR